MQLLTYFEAWPQVCLVISESNNQFHLKVPPIKHENTNLGCDSSKTLQ